MVKDALGRNWQLGTIQVDYTLPNRFELKYKGKDNKNHQPVMIHRAPFGSLERFVAILLEHTGGNFPLWLIPIQAIILTVSKKCENYAEKVFNSLENNEIRAQLDSRDETIGKKIREAELKKHPFMLIIGDNEVNKNTISVRKHKFGVLGDFSTDEFIKKLNVDISESISKFENN